VEFVGVEEGPVEGLGQELAEGGFAGTGDAEDEDDH
jgi:hypothetical protein